MYSSSLNSVENRNWIGKLSWTSRQSASEYAVLDYNASTILAGRLIKVHRSRANRAHSDSDTSRDPNIPELRTKVFPSTEPRLGRVPPVRRHDQLL